MADITSVEIFPPLGIARVGDSQEFYLAPEVPGLMTTMPMDIQGQPITKFRDAESGIKRQAVRFHAYGYDETGGNVRELTSTDGYIFTWKVHVVNMKAASNIFRGRLRPDSGKLRNPDVDSDKPIYERTRLIIDPGLQTITSADTEVPPVPLVGTFQGSADTPVPVALGELRLDSKGRLIFLGGSGRSAHVKKQGKLHQPEILSEFDSIGWFDDTCDGWVEVEVNKAGWDQPIVSRHRAAVGCSVPKFAWGIRSPTSVYDVIQNIYDENGVDGPQNAVFYRDIWPVLSSASNTAWLNDQGHKGHSSSTKGNFYELESRLSDPTPNPSNAELRDHIFSRLREPGNVDHANTRYMPRLSGDDGDAIEPGSLSIAAITARDPIYRFATLTPLQYRHFRQWKDGNFTIGEKLTDPVIGNYPASQQPELLTRAMLEQGVGDAFYPGIELYWIAKDETIYDYDTDLDPPFRFDFTKIRAGDLSRGLSLPWQSDYSLCNTHWWPTARPDVVFVQLGDDYVQKNWTRYLRDSPDDLSSFPGSTDMIKYWSGLGFVVPEAGNRWTERERTLPEF
ncbi:hypothetical protein AX17_002812 [Amanita inopinata Kibby_2008]|nr:hypothetical protein AX17_002812 [Amanita inopinata Kibby_2008]